MSSQLETLKNEFNSLITEYQTTYISYINTINSNNLITVPNSAFVSPTTISVISNSTLDDCITQCSENTSCSGATFNTTLNNCTLGSGNGNVVPSTESTSIIQESLYYSYKLKQLNQQLLEINNQIINISNQNYSEFQQTRTQIHASTLNYNYDILKKEKLEIEKMVRQFETLNSAYENGNININSNYYTYILLLIFVIILVFLFFTFSLPVQKGGNDDKNGTFDFINFILELLLFPLKLIAMFF